MTDSSESLEIFMNTAAAFLDLEISEDRRESVLDNLKVLGVHAAQVMAFPVSEDLDLAPIFRP